MLQKLLKWFITQVKNWELNFSPFNILRYSERVLQYIKSSINTYWINKQADKCNSFESKDKINMGGEWTAKKV